MNAVHQILDGTKNSVLAQPSAGGETMVPPVTGQPLGDNERRATEIGPVLEEILRSHWEHWGLND